MSELIDLIDRYKLLNDLEESKDDNPHIKVQLWRAHEFEHLHTIRVVRDQPSVKRAEGYWIDVGKSNADGNIRRICSNCGAGDLQPYRMEVPYCWNCGSRMQKEDNKIDG